MTELVLVVDLDKQLGTLVSAMLSTRGYAVESLDSASAALALLKSRSPQIIIVGEQLADVDGLGFLAKLRDTNNKIPLVFVARQWREEGFYRMLKEDLKASLIVHRPLRATVFTAQVLGLLGLGPMQSAAALSGGQSGTLPLPLVEPASTKQMSGGEFDRLRARFIRSIPDRLSRLSQALSKLSIQSALQPVDFEEAIVLAHNLKGTALSWGFEELGHNSELMENTLKAASAASEEKRGEMMDGTGRIYASMATSAESVLEHLKLADSSIPASLMLQPAEEQQDASTASNAAKVLVVSDEPPPSSVSRRTESGLLLDLIHVRREDALEKAAQLLLDAALIEIGPNDSSLVLARKLRDITGFESLPLGFISSCDAADARAEATHAGSSLFLMKPLDGDLVQKVISQLIAMRQGGRFRVLVVDDDVDLADLTCRCLGQFGMITRSVHDPFLVNQVVHEFNPDLILLDITMPGMSGLELCRSLRSNSRWRDVPILFLTAQTDLNSRLTAYEAGGDDYLPKPVINVELLTRVKVRLERARELKERSERDLLTGLLLRRAFTEQANALISEGHARSFQFCLCLLDIDHFKGVNDRYGHQAGDDVLAALGLLLRKRFRVEDLRGRWGGEEFVLAFKHERKEVMHMALTRILEELKKIEFQGEAGQTFHVSFSAGLAAFPEEAGTLQELLKVADRRLYQAKERGRQQIVMVDLDLDLHATTN